MLQRWFAVVPVALAMAGTTMITTPLAAGAAGDRLQTRSVSTFRLEPDQGRVAVTVDLSITDASDGGNKGNDRSVAVVIQKGASDVRVSGKRTDIDLVKQGDALDTYEVTYPPSAKGQTRDVRVSYDLAGSDPESGLPTRVDEAYAYFCLNGQRTDETDVTAILPQGYSPGALPDGVSTQTRDGQTMLVPVDAKSAMSLNCVESSKSSALIEESVATPSGEAVVVAGWPEDVDWVDAVAWQVGVALPVLTDWVELPLPVDEITVQESSAQALAGYDGSFDRSRDVILVSETAQQSTVVTHELAHAWFNTSTMTDMWMIEGGAEWAAKMTHGFECQDPATFDLPGKVKLSDWHIDGAVASRSDNDLVSYQYAAACWIHQQVTEEIGFDGMADVNHALLARLPKYEGDPDPAAGKADWREWLDAVDEVGLVPAGATDLEFAERLLLEFGIAKPKDLAGRAEARAAYHAARDAWGESMPVVVSRAMDAWEFDAAMTAMDITSAIMDDLAAAGAGPAPNGSETLLGEVAAAETIDQLKALRERAAELA